MGIQELQAIAEIVAAAAVVASLIFVGYQLRQSNTAIRSSNGQAAVNNWNQLSLMLATDEHLNRGMMASTYPEIEQAIPFDSDKSMLIYFTTASMKTIEETFSQWQSGNLADSTWRGFNEALIMMFTYNSVWTEYWEMNQNIHSKQFKKLVESVIEDSLVRRRELTETLSK